MLIIISTALGCGDPIGAPKHSAAQIVYHSASLELTILTTCQLAPNIRRINGLLGLYTPSIVTPLELLEDTNSE
jgi:hypothetical protein